MLHTRDMIWIFLIWILEFFILDLLILVICLSQDFLFLFMQKLNVSWCCKELNYLWYCWLYLYFVTVCFWMFSHHFVLCCWSRSFCMISNLGWRLQIDIQQKPTDRRGYLTTSHSTNICGWTRVRYTCKASSFPLCPFSISSILSSLKNTLSLCVTYQVRCIRAASLPWFYW